MNPLPLPVKKRLIQRRFNGVTNALDMAYLHFHDRRHSAASEMINSGANLYEVGTELGHRSPQSTMRYAHQATDTLVSALDRTPRKSGTEKNKAPEKGLYR